MSGLQQFQQQIDVVGNNIANVNTTAFKTARTDFEDSFNQALAGNGSSGQVGSGVGTSAITNNFNAGVTSRTGVDTDLSISGQGFFMLRDTVDNSQRATRAGNFHLNSSSFLVSNDGLRVQGFSDSALGARGDILIDATGAPATTAVGATVESFNIDQNGSINVRMTDGTTFVRGQVLLQNFRDQSRLVKEGNNRFSGTDAAGP